jgi:hypothetical protein
MGTPVRDTLPKLTELRSMDAPDPVCNRSYPAVCAEAKTEATNNANINKLFNTVDLVTMDNGFFIEVSLLKG